MSVEVGFEDLHPYLTSSFFAFSPDPCILHVVECDLSVSCCSQMMPCLPY